MKRKILTQFDTVGYTSKPKGKEGLIKSRLKNGNAEKYNINDFINQIETGHTMYPVQANGIKAANWEAQELFCVDIDNDINEVPIQTIEDSLKICDKYKIKPLVIYNTYSDTETLPKYRILFLCNELITDNHKRNLIITTLIRLFPQADPACKNADRMFLGTNKKVCYKDKNATFSYEDIIRINGELPPAIQPEDKTKDNTVHNINGINLYDEIKNFDLYSFLQQECGTISHIGSNYTMFHECPICNGHDDFVHYHNTNTYTCFVKNETGNIITYLMNTKRFSKSEAVKYFLQDLCGYSLNQISAKTVPVPATININNGIKEILEQFKQLEKKPESYSQDDKGMGELFSLVIKNILRYNVDRKCWMYYNGKVWVDDTGSAKVNKYAKYFTDALVLYTFEDVIFEDIKNEKQRAKEIDDIRKAINKLGAKNKRDAIVKDAESEFPIRNKVLDSNTDLLNLLNGTLKLSTFEFKEHTPNDMLSLIANVEYDPNASSEVFEKFLSEIFDGDICKIKYIQKVMGYCLTASTKEETFFILFGPTTRNGKTTFIEVIIFMLGDYAKQANPETFAIKKFSDSRTANGDIARLCGTRLVNSTELPKGMVLDVAKIKTLTGGDTVTARGLYQSEFQFTPNFKLFLTTNHLPQVNDDTLFTSNRVNVITFDRHFKPEEQDKNLKKKLRKKEVLSGILNWCIEGLKAYRTEGLEPPICVIKANKNFQAQSDIVSIFLSENFEQSEENTKLQAAYNLYCQWCKEQGYYAGSKADFNEVLKSKGITATMNGRRNLLKGLTIKSDVIF